MDLRGAIATQSRCQIQRRVKDGVRIRLEVEKVRLEVGVEVARPTTQAVLWDRRADCEASQADGSHLQE